MTMPRWARNAQMVVARLDALSRVRSLSPDESTVLEHFIAIADGKRAASYPQPRCTNRTLARLGIKEEIAALRRAERPNSKVVSRG